MDHETYLPHVGEHIADALDGHGVTLEQLAVAAKIVRLDDLVAGARPMLTEDALRLARFFGTSVEFWQSLDADCTRRRLEADLRAVVPLPAVDGPAEDAGAPDDATSCGE